MNLKSNVAACALVMAAVWPTAESAGAAQQPPQATILAVVYPTHEGARFDIAYYRARHIPLAMKVMQAERVTLIEGVPTGDAAPPYAMIAHFQFSSPEALQSAVASPAMADVRADIATFTDIRPIVMFAR